MNEQLAETIALEMLPFAAVVTAHDTYIRVWNCYTGSIMGAYNRKLDSVAKAHNMKAGRIRTFGDGRISSADWEDRLVEY
jgi:hypothetical protein